MDVNRTYTMGGDEVSRTYYVGRDEFVRLCDAIDSIHANLERENASLKAELDRLMGEQDRDGWIELPKDADGEYIHIGDVMEWPEDGETFEVVGIGDGWTLFYVIEDGVAEWTRAESKRHHHEPTVEDVLTEFGIDWEHESDCEDRAALLKEYASKLRLAEGEDA